MKAAEVIYDEYEDENCMAHLYAAQSKALFLHWLSLRNPNIDDLKVYDPNCFSSLSLYCTYHYILLFNIHKQESLNTYKKALEYPVNIANPQIMFELAQVYVSIGAYNGALEIFKRILIDFSWFDKLSECIFITAMLLIE